MLTNERRLNLVQRLNVLQQEIAEIASVLYENPCPITSEDIDRGVQGLLNRNGYLELSSLEKQLEVGMDDAVLATYHPKAEKNQLRPYSPTIDDQLLLVFQRLIEIKKYRIVEGDEDANAFCIRMVNGKQAAKPEDAGVQVDPKTQDAKANPPLWTIIVTEEEPVNPLVKIGPNSVIRQKASEETLAQHLEMCGLSRIDFEEKVAEIRDTISDKAVYWVHMVESKDAVKTDGSH